MPKLTEQFESRLSAVFTGTDNFPVKPWKVRNTRSRAFTKTVKHRGERHRAKLDPEVQPLYRKYHGWEF